VATSTTIDGIAGWDDLLVVLIAIRCYIKEQQTPSNLLEQRDQLFARIAQMAVDRGQVQAIADTRSYEDGGDNYYGRRW
jgi:hypothetical protein